MGKAKHLLPPIAFVAFVACAHFFRGGLPGFCLFKTLTGIPCPGCGITRSILALLGGDAASSFRLNPAGPVVVMFFAVLLVVALVDLRSRVAPEKIAAIRIHCDRALAAALLFSWIIRLR